MALWNGHRWLLLPLLIVWADVLRAGPAIPSESLSFHRWGREDGLLDDTVTALLQTQDGYLWVGTASGLARFDGVEFDRVSLPGAGSNQVVAVTSLCEDDMHRLWIGTRESGLFWLSAGVVRRFTDGAQNESVTSLAADGRGQLWVGTAAGLFRVSLATLRTALPSLGFTNELVSSVHAARSGTIWITTSTGMSQYKNGRITAVEFEAQNPGRARFHFGRGHELSGFQQLGGPGYSGQLRQSD
jgi:ligand-binding sensor domain-containing protein